MPGSMVVLILSVGFFRGGVLHVPGMGKYMGMQKEKLVDESSIERIYIYREREGWW